MADREVKVRIRGEEDVSGAAKKAEGGLSALKDRIRGIGIAAGVLAAGAALGKFLKDSLEEAAKAEVGMARLGNAVENAGGDFAVLRPEIEATVAKVQKLSTATDDDLREALTRMIAVTGDTKGSLQNLTLVTDLAAFKQVDLETAALSVAKAMNGNTTALNKLGFAGKDATTVLESMRGSIGGFAATEAKTFGGSLTQIKNQWGEFQEAVGKAILSTGEVGAATSGLAGILGGLAVWVEKNEEGIAVFTSALFDGVKAVGAVAGAVWDVLGPPLTWLAKVAFVGVVARLNTIALGLKRTAGVFQEFAGTALAAIGSLVEKGGKLFKLFGIDVVQETGTSLKKFGEDMVKNGTAAAERATTEYGAAMGRLKNLITGAEGEHTDLVKQGEGERRRLVRTSTEAQTADHLAMEQARQKAARESNELFQKTIDLLKKQNLTAHAEQWAEIDRNVRLVKGDLSDTLPGAEALKAEIDKNKDAMAANAAAAKDNKNTIKDSVADAAQLGRAFLDVGQATGVVSAEMAGVLNSVMNIGTSLAQIGIDPMGGMIGVIGGLANVISGLGNNEAHKKYMAALAANRQSLDRLTKEVGNFNLGASGRTFQGVASAIDATNAANASGQFGTGPTADAKALGFFVQQLAKAGVSLEDAKALMGELGFGFGSAQEFRGGLGTFASGFGATEFGQFGEDFDSSLESVQTGWDILEIEDNGTKLEQLSALADKFSPALGAALRSANPKAALQALFKKLQSGGLTPADFGRLNPRQFLDMITLLLPLVGASGGGDVGEMSLDGGDLGGADAGVFPGFEPGSFDAFGKKGKKFVTGGLDGYGPDGWFPVPNLGTSGDTTGYGGTATVINVTGNSFEFGPVTVAPDGKSTEETGEDLAAMVAAQLARRLRDQAAAAGVPI